MYSPYQNQNFWQEHRTALVLFLVLLLAVLFLPNNSFSQNTGPWSFPVNQSVPPGSQINNSQYYAYPQQGGQLSMQPADLELTSKIRAEIAGDRNLSQKAQNISIISQNGRVILQGYVISEYEKSTVLNMAERVAGSNQVFSQLVVQP